jgi:hypothetical protein
MSRKFSGNKPPSKSRGVPVDVFGDDDDDLESFGSQTAASAGPSTFDFVLSSKPQSKKERQREAAAAEVAAAAAAAEAKKSQRMLICPHYRWRPRSPPPPPPPLPPAVTCEICNRPKPKGDLDWKKSTMGISNQGLCPDCDVDPKSPKLVWAPEADMLSQWHAQTLEALTRAGNPSNQLKKEVQLSTKLHHPLTPKQHTVSLRGAHNYLSSAFLIPPAGVRPFSRLVTEKYKNEMHSRMNKQQQRKRGGTRRKSKSKSRF